MIARTRMTAEEFRQLPETNRTTQLLAGEIVVSPSPAPGHQRVLAKLFRLLDGHIKDGEVVLSPMDVYLDEINVVQPDLFWASANGKCKAREDGWYGTPDLIVEVLSPGSSRRDKVDKYRLYEQHGVREYWIIEPTAQWIEAHILTDGKFAHIGTYAGGDRFVSP